MFHHMVHENTVRSKAAIVMGSISFDDSACEIFESVAPASDSVSVNVASVTAGKSGGVSAERLAKLFSIAHDNAEWTLSVKAQRNRQSADSSLSHNFGMNDWMLQYRRISSTFFTDTLYVTAKARSTRGNTCTQVFVSDKDFVALYPMRDTKSFFSSLKVFARRGCTGSPCM